MSVKLGLCDLSGCLQIQQTKHKINNIYQYNIIAYFCDTYQQCIASSYTALGHPGGGAIRIPSSTSMMAYSDTYSEIQNLWTMTSSLHHKRRRFSVYLIVGPFFERFVSKTPYLKHHTAKAPHITGRGELLEVQRLQMQLNTINVTKTHFMAAMVFPSCLLRLPSGECIICC